MVCGYIYQFQNIPELCPVCNSGKEKLKKIDPNTFMEIEDFNIFNNERSV